MARSLMERLAYEAFRNIAKLLRDSADAIDALNGTGSWAPTPEYTETAERARKMADDLEATD